MTKKNINNLKVLLANIADVEGYYLSDNELINCCEDAGVKITFLQIENCWGCMEDVAVKLNNEIEIPFHNGMDPCDFFDDLNESLKRM